VTAPRNTGPALSEGVPFILLPDSLETAGVGQGIGKAAREPSSVLDSAAVGASSEGERVPSSTVEAATNVEVVAIIETMETEEDGMTPVLPKASMTNQAVPFTLGAALLLSSA
jgi:hypothetical protein